MVTVLLPDPEIARLLADPKSPRGGRPVTPELRAKRGHAEAAVELAGSSGDRFRLIVRRSRVNLLAFSVVLAVQMPQTNRWFRLRRMNGKNHQHTNPLEKQTFRDFHIHEATERYQEAGFREDTYAMPTDRFADLNGAFPCLLQDAAVHGLERLSLPLASLFGG